MTVPTAPELVSAPEARAAWRASGWPVIAARRTPRALPGGGPRRHRRRTALLLATDATALGVSLALGVLAVAPFGSARAVLPLAAASGAMALALMAARGLYRTLPLPPVQEIRAQSLSVMTALGVAAVLERLSPLDWGALGVGAIVSMFALPAARAGVRAAFSRRPWWTCRAVVLGAGRTARAVVRTLREQPDLSLQPVALLDDDPARPGRVEGVPVAGPVSLARRMADEVGVECLVIALPRDANGRIADIVERYGSRFERVLVVPDLVGLDSLWGAARDLDGTLGLEIRQRLLTPWRQAAKRLVDVASAVLLLALLSLPMAALVLAIRLDSRGPAVFRQLRLGRDGRCFSCFKFRTMHPDGDALFEAHLAGDAAARAEWARFKKLRHDPRVTRVGRWLRRGSLDELPQLWNVIRGEMSLVGPRAYLPRELDDMRRQAWPILRVRPGITGLWQVSGRNQISFDGRLALDVQYVRSWSFSLDLYLLARTVPAVFFSRGAS